MQKLTYSKGFAIGGVSSILDMQWAKETAIAGNFKFGDLSLQQTAAIGGMTYGLVGSKFYSTDMTVSFSCILFNISRRFVSGFNLIIDYNL